MTRLRIPTYDDVAAMARLEESCFGADAWSQASLQQTLGPGTGCWVRVVDVDGGCGGYVLGLPRGDVLDLARVAVAASARGQGLGTELVEALVAYAWQAGFARVLLEVGERNDPARRLYDRLGFAEIDRRSGYYADGEDALVLQREPDDRRRWTGDGGD